MGFDFHVHGLWIIGALFFFVAGVMAGNLQWVMGTTEVSYAISVILIFVLFLVAAMFWISAAVNARFEEFQSKTAAHYCVHCHHYRCICKKNVIKNDRFYEETPSVRRV